MTDFGTDVSTFPDLDPSFTPISGTRVVAEAIARRLMTPRGSLAGYPNYGYDLRAAVNEYMGLRDQLRIQSAVAGECEADERVNRANVVVTFSAPTSQLTVTVRLETAAGPFVLVLAVTALSLTILQIR